MGKQEAVSEAKREPTAVCDDEANARRQEKRKAAAPFTAEEANREDKHGELPE
jgi:hypothetical protein